MPPTPPSPDSMRRRAATLRTVASTLDHSQALDLHRRAGDDVWLGPTPRRCHDDLITIRTLLLQAGRDLRTGARDLEVRAAALEASGG